MNPRDPQHPLPRTWTLLLAALCALSPSPAGADAGDLDPTFSGDGKVVTEFPLAHQDTARAVAVQPDGRILVAGDVFWSGTGLDFTLVRYNGDGSLDLSFGAGGIARAHFLGADRAMDLALQPDGKILVAGYTDFNSGASSFALARFNRDGSLDAGFGDAGRVVTHFPGVNSWIEGIAVRPDGRILAGGSLGSTNPDLALAQYNPDGSLDAGFGNGGRVISDIPGQFARANAMALQPDGKAVLAGFVFHSANSYDTLLVRYNSDGSLDSAFGTAGSAILDIRAIDHLEAVALQPDGRIVAAGTTIGSGGAPWNHLVVRYDANGTLDPSFGMGGIVAGAPSSLRYSYALALQQNGKIIVGGLAVDGGVYFGLARHLADGTLDPEFGEDGTVVTDFSFDRGAWVLGLDLQKDGRIIAAGTVNTSASTHTYAVARYLGDEVEEQGVCLQDESGAPTLRFDPATGAYRFSDPGSGFLLEARGTVTVDGCSLHLKDHGSSPKKPERILNVVVDTCTGQGHATLRISSSKRNFKIRDRTLANSSCD